MRRTVNCTEPVLPAGSTRRYLPSLSVVALTRSEGMLTIAPTSGAPPGVDFTCPDTVVASCAIAMAGTSPSRTSPIVKMERTNQRLSVIHFLPLLRFSGPTTDLRERGDGLPARGWRDQPVLQQQRNSVATRRLWQGGPCQHQVALKQGYSHAYRWSHAETVRHTRLGCGWQRLPAHRPRRRRTHQRLGNGVRKPLAAVQRPPCPPPSRPPD